MSSDNAHHEEKHLRISRMFIFLIILNLFLIAFFAVIYYELGQYYPDSFAMENPEQMDFWTALYFSTITQSTVGYGDITPKSNIARLTVMLQALVFIVEMIYFATVITVI